MKTRITAPLQARRGDPRGQVLVLFALMLVVLLLISALAVDYGGWLVARRNYQNITDAASLAGAQQLTRPLTAACATGPSKNFCARQAAWESVKTALKFGAGLDPATQAGLPSNTPYIDGSGYKVWVASPPSDAGSAYPGHVSGSGVVFVRVDHPGTDYLSRIAGTNRTVTAWSTAGRFPANFAVVGMCSPTSITANCLAGDANIKLDGNNTNLIVGTGDLGTNRWTKAGGNNSGVALGPDSNAYMQLFDTCWTTVTQCQLWGYNDPTIDYSTTRAAIPLGAPIPDPAYPAPPIDATTAPNQCRGTGTVSLASMKVIERNTPNSQVADLPIKLASAIQPMGPIVPLGAGKPKLSGLVESLVGSTLLNGITITATPDGGPDTTGQGPNPNGGYSMSVNGGATYTITATDPSGVYNTTTTTQAVAASDVTAPVIFMPKNPVVSGTVTSSLGGGALSGVTVTITVLGVNYTTTTNASGFYSKTIPVAGALINYTIVGALSGYVSGGTSVNAPTAYDTNYTRNFSLTPAPASLSGTITDAVANPTNLPVPGVTVTLGSGQTTTTDATGSYNFPAVNPGTTTITLSGTAMDGYAYSTPVNPYSITIAAGTNTKNFTVWPKGCYDGNSGGSFGNWSCSLPSGNNCPATTNVDASNVTCTFTQANAIRPGTYNNITLPNGTCAWFDPKGGVTGLQSGQSAGIYHVKGTISIGSNSYLFGDGVTIAMDQGSNFDVNNGGGFVLNFGSLHNTVNNAASGCNLSSVYSWANHNAGYVPCFRTVDDGQDYAYAAWTTMGHNPWACSGTQASPPVYATTCVTVGQELGITFYLNGSGLGNASRFKLATANMGYLFNGVLYGPNDDIQLGGGKDGQSAAGQIVGWTIEYHGGTRILQNWYGEQVDGEPFLIEPVLGE